MSRLLRTDGSFFFIIISKVVENREDCANNGAKSLGNSDNKINVVEKHFYVSPPRRNLRGAEKPDPCGNGSRPCIRPIVRLHALFASAAAAANWFPRQYYIMFDRKLQVFPQKRSKKEPPGSFLFAYLSSIPRSFFFIAAKSSSVMSPASRSALHFWSFSETSALLRAL